MNLNNYKTFQEVYPKYEDLKQDFYLFTKEMLEKNNWFIELDILWETIYRVFVSNTYGSVFKWEAPDELEFGIDGQFTPLLFTTILNFYKNQLILLPNDLNELKDWHNRGNSALMNRDFSNTGYSTPAPSFKWDEKYDKPQQKDKTEIENNMTNRIRDIFNLIKTNLNIYLDDIFPQFNYMFINKYWLED